MNIWNRIRSLSLKQLIQLGWLFVSHPLLIRPTLQATRQTIKICDALYGKRHHKNGKANAFRHALWNMLICQKTVKWTKNEAKSVKWSQKVTDLHEKLAPNASLETAMDLHNNEIGRRLFSMISTQNDAKTVEIVQKSVLNAQKVTAIEDFEQFKDQLLYLE
ncbi:MAG: hypothetical protein MK211_07440 [Flavobacteriales bacterium]|nr:hypothetical protein [Flavobacteriales bacterium]